MSREDAYTVVQTAAMKVWAGESNFLELLQANAAVTARMSVAEIEACFDLDYHVKQVGTIFKRVFGGD
jgi:adenylosuccinate lyase